MIKTIEFEGHVFEYDDAEAKDYRNLKRVMKSATNPSGLFDAMERIFAGKDEEYAEMLGGNLEKLGQLAGKVFEESMGKN